MPKRTRTALGQQDAAVARRKRTGADAPKTRAELYEIGSNATCQGAPRWDATSSPGSSARNNREGRAPAIALSAGRKGRSEMARAIWSGVLTFGLVSVPVELYSATETVTASRVGGIPALVDHDVNGLLVAPGDAAALAAAISRVLTEPGTAARLAAARQTAQRYTWPALARQVAAVYLQVTGKPRPA
jgi:hypothetical protein